MNLYRSHTHDGSLTRSKSAYDVESVNLLAETYNKITCSLSSSIHLPPSLTISPRYFEIQDESDNDSIGSTSSQKSDVNISNIKLPCIEDSYDSIKINFKDPVSRIKNQHIIPININKVTDAILRSKPQKSKSMSDIYQCNHNDIKFLCISKQLEDLHIEAQSDHKLSPIVSPWMSPNISPVNSFIKLN